MTSEIHSLLPQMIGGDEERFFREYWRTRTLFTESALPQLRGFYDYEHFLHDYRRVDWHDATLVISVDKQGNRKMMRADQCRSVDAALADGMSIVLQALLLPGNLPTLPPEWRWFMNLHNALCDHLLPGFPPNNQAGGPVAALDVFCTSSETSSGGHYDTGDVFYFVLDGEKEWTVELAADVENGLRLAASDTAKIDLPPRNEHVKVHVRPGDCLYVPPYTYHRVSSCGKSLAVSVGLPTFTELTLLRTSLIRMQKERTPYRPLPSFPRTHLALLTAAEAEVRTRILNVLGLSVPTT